MMRTNRLLAASIHGLVKYRKSIIFPFQRSYFNGSLPAINFCRKAAYGANYCYNCCRYCVARPSLSNSAFQSTANLNDDLFTSAQESPSDDIDLSEYIEQQSDVLREVELVDEMEFKEATKEEDFEQLVEMELFDHGADLIEEFDIGELIDLSTKELFNLVKPSLREGRKLKHYFHSTFHLQVLVALFGVDLHRIDLKKDSELTRILMRTDIKSDIIPRLNLLQSFCDISLSDFGKVMGKCPHVLEQPLESLLETLNYLKRCNFSPESMKQMFVKHPRTLLMKPIAIDETLCVLQLMTDLQPQDLKSIVISAPRLITSEMDQVTFNRNLFRDKFLFDIKQFHRALLNCPEILLIRCLHLESIYDYLSNELKLSNEIISHSSEIFRSQLRNVKTFHLFLKSLNRDQYDPSKPLYVSLKCLASNDLFETCKELSLCTDRLIAFMKTL